MEDLRDKAVLVTGAASGKSPIGRGYLTLTSVERDKYLVVTTPLFKIAYFVRRHFPLLWFMAMKMMSRSFWKMIEKAK